ncbi:MAG: bifunctional adenosylcobinamide kinase/adenosylcobinamide-phosphate guanylyltransferase [Oscillospiraceae bacterium]|nr:bifunctional adenosylcobinamide kinase/adenosylcobinamide-phosphate guanylyltransferase [Oscillospiraceae bacterium]
MFTLVIGGSASGKSEFAERHVLSLDGPRLYIATMEPFGVEAQARIARHRAARRDRGFETVDSYVNLTDLEIQKGANALLEDLGNLTANELFRPDGDVGRVVPGIEHLLARCRHMTVVTNEVFSGGKDYEGETLRYLRELAQINRVLAARADLVVEVVCGLPNLLKGEFL